MQSGYSMHSPMEFVECLNAANLIKSYPLKIVIKSTNNNEIHVCPYTV